MDIEQLQKRIQWIEEDRRKEKDSLALLENKVTGLEGGIAALIQQVKDQSGEIIRLSAIIIRMDQYDQSLIKTRVENKQSLDDLDKTIKLRIDEAEKFHQAEARSLENSVLELQKQLEAIPRLEKNIQSRVDFEIAIRRSLDELRNNIDAVRVEEEEYTRTIRLLEDGRRQDAKRIVDLQGEVNALRKRMDDQRGQTELVNTSLHKLETRLSELVTIEGERRDMITNFLDKQAVTQVDRERVWKEWQSKFDTIEKQAMDIESQLISLDSTHRDVKRTQTVLEELTQRVERRINEITEIQRLSEDRFRQEWVSFKGDDQKRWTNYTLTLEEQRNEVARQHEKLAEKVTHIEDTIQEIQDILQQMNEQSEKQLQSLLAITHEWVTSFERSIGRTR